MGSERPYRRAAKLVDDNAAQENVGCLKMTSLADSIGGQKPTADALSQIVAIVGKVELLSTARFAYMLRTAFSKSSDVEVTY